MNMEEDCKKISGCNFSARDLCCGFAMCFLLRTISNFLLFASLKSAISNVFNFLITMFSSFSSFDYTTSFRKQLPPLAFQFIYS